jgi:hypothetical protein
VANLDKNLKFLRDHLDPGEEVEAAVQGSYEVKIMGSDSVRTGILAATDRRVIYFAKKVGGYDFESFQYKSIASIEASKSFLGHSISIHTTGNTAKMKQINKGDVAGFVGTVRDRMGRSDSPVGVADELSKLAALRDAGLLSASEWERATSLFLGKPSSARDEAIAQLRSLHALHRDGVLSESEFNSKKWDVLARNN